MKKVGQGARTQILVAVIGVFGVVAAAVISNWTSLFPHHVQSISPAVTANTASNPAISKSARGAAMDPNTVRKPPAPNRQPNHPGDESQETTLWFQTKDQGRTVYYPNVEPYISSYRGHLSDETTFYFCGCDLLPASQRSNCDSTNNWFRVPASLVHCTSVGGCLKGSVLLPEPIKSYAKSHLTSPSGQPL